MSTVARETGSDGDGRDKYVQNKRDEDLFTDVFKDLIKQASNDRGNTDVKSTEPESLLLSLPSEFTQKGSRQSVKEVNKWRDLLNQVSPGSGTGKAESYSRELFLIEAGVETDPVIESTPQGGNGNGNGNCSTETAAQKLAAQGVDVTRTEMLPIPLKFEETSQYLNATTDAGRRDAIEALRQKAEGVVPMGPGQGPLIHAKMAYQQVLLMDGVIKLGDAQAAVKQARQNGNPQAIAAAQKDELDAVKNIVRLEGKGFVRADAYLNGYANQPVRPGDRVGPGGTGPADLVARARSEENEFAIGMFDSVKRQKNAVPPTPEEYARALERLYKLSQKKPPDAMALRMLAPLQDEGIDHYLDQLKGPNGAAAMKVIDSKLVRTPELMLKPQDVLRDVDAATLNRAKNEEEKTLRENLTKVAIPLDKFVTVADGKTASSAERKQAIAEVKKAGEKSGLNLKPLTDYMAVTDLVLEIHQSDDPKKAADALRELQALAENKNSPNVRASWTMAHLQLQCPFEEMLQTLDGDDRVKATQMLAKLRDELPKSSILDTFADYKVRCVAASLPENYKSADLDALARQLEKLPDANKYAADMRNWASTESELIRMQESGGDVSKLNVAFDALANQANSGNRYAVQALTESLLKPDDAVSIRKARWEASVGNDEKVLSYASLANLYKKQADFEAARERVAQAVTSLPSKLLTRTDWTSLAVTASTTKESPNEATQKYLSLMKGKLAEGVTGETKPAVMNGLMDAVSVVHSSDNHTIADTYLVGLDSSFISSPDFQKRHFPSFKKWAKEDGDESSIRILTALSAGQGSLTSSEVLDDSRSVIGGLAARPELHKKISAAALEVAEPLVENSESSYNPANSKYSQHLAALHDYMADVYKQCGNKSEEKRHRYEVDEIYRVEKTLSRSKDDARLDLPTQLYKQFTNLPEKLNIAAAGDRAAFEVSQGGFARILDAVPGLRLSMPARQALTGLEAISLDGNKLSIKGKSSIDVNGALLGKPGLEGIGINLNNVTADIKADKDSVTLTNIKNLKLTMSKASMGDLFESVKLTIDNKNPDAPVLKANLKFGSNISFWLKQFNSPQEQQIDIPITPQQGAQFSKVVSEFQKPEKDRDLRVLAKSLLDVKDSSLDQFLSGFQSISREKDKLKLSSDKEQSFSFGDIELKVDKTASVSIEQQARDSFTLKDIEGVSTKLPLPAELKAALKLGDSINIKSIQLDEADNVGNRKLTIKTDSSIESVSIKLDKNLKPLETEGMQQIDCVFKIGDGRVKASLSLNPTQLADKGVFGSNFSVYVSGDMDARKGFLEAVGVPDFIVDGVKDVRYVKKQGDTISILRDGKEPVRFGRDGVVMSLEPNVTFKLKRSVSDKIEDIDVTMTGVKIAELPLNSETLSSAYSGKFPITLNKIALRTENGKLKRCDIVDASSIIRAASFNMDEAGDISSAQITVENPASLLLGGGAKAKAKTSVTVRLSKKEGSLEPDNKASAVAESIGGAFVEKAPSLLGLTPAGLLVRPK